MPPLVRRLPNLLAVGGLVLLAAFSWTEKGPSRALQWPWYLYAQSLVILPILWLLGQLAATGRVARFGALLDLGLLGFAGAAILSALTSGYRDTALAMLPTTLAPVATAYGVALWLGDGNSGQRREHIASFGGVFFSITAAIALGGWIVTRTLPALRAGTPFLSVLNIRNEWLLGHSVYTAGLGLLCTAWLGGLAFERTGHTRLLCLLGAVLGFALLFSAGSRGGFAGFSLWICWLLRNETRRRQWTMRRTATAAAITLAVFASLALLHPRPRLMFNKWRESRAINIGDRQRLAMGEFGAIALREHPLLGFGPGTTPLVYPAYRARLSGGVESALQLHSTPVQWVADAGFPALAAALLTGFGLWWHRRRAPATFASGTLLAYAAFALTDYQLDLPLFAFSVGTLLGLIAHSPLRSANSSNVRPQLKISPATSVGIPLALATGIYLTTQSAPLRARAAFACAIEALEDGDRSAFAVSMQNAHRIAPKETYYFNVHASLLTNLHYYPAWFPPIDFGPGRKTEAIMLLKQSTALDPRQELPYTHLGWLQLEEKPTAALGNFRAAAALIPDKGSLYYGQALALLQLGRTAEAASALAMELVNDPAFVASPEWVYLAQTPGLAFAARDNAVRQLERIADEAPSTDPLGYSRRARYTAALLRWINGDNSALESIREHAEPAQRHTLEWLAGRSDAPPAQPTQPWHYLAKATATPALAAQILVTRYQANPPVLEAVAEMAARLASSDRRALIQGDAITAFSTQPRIYRERIAYPLLMRNLDAPAVRDPYIVPLNRLVRDFLPGLFPEKGYLPGPVLIMAQENLGLRDQRE